MTPLGIALITLGLLLFLLMSGVHLATTLMVTSVVGVYLVTGRMSTALVTIRVVARSTVYVDGVVCESFRCKSGIVRFS